jgi:arginyl-tRNA synthetase
MNVLAHIRSLFEPVFLELISDKVIVSEYLAMIKPANPINGDYQANFAIKIAKELGTNPQDVADRIVELLNSGNI